jgi:ABC-type transport system involved in cytochrome bd biosynthesis fused ATPase/permease subunit
VLQVATAVTEGLGLVLVVPIVQSLGGASRLHLPATDVQISLRTAFALVVGVVLVRALAQWRSAVLALDIRLRTIDGIRLDLLADLYGAEWTYLANQRRSIVVQRLTTEVERAHNALTALVRLLVGALVLLMTVAAGIVIAPLIGALSALCLVAVALLARGSIAAATRLGRRISERMADFGAALTDSLASVRVMRAHDAADAWLTLVGSEAARVRHERRRFVSSTTGIVAAIGMVAVLAVLGVILAGRAAGMETAELAALALVATRLLSSAQALVITAQSFANSPTTRRPWSGCVTSRPTSGSTRSTRSPRRPHRGTARRPRRPRPRWSRCAASP